MSRKSRRFNANEMRGLFLLEQMWQSFKKQNSIVRLLKKVASGGQRINKIYFFPQLFTLTKPNQSLHPLTFPIFKKMKFKREMPTLWIKTQSLTMSTIKLLGMDVYWNAARILIKLY